MVDDKNTHADILTTNGILNSNLLPIISINYYIFYILIIIIYHAIKVLILVKCSYIVSYQTVFYFHIASRTN